MNTSFTTFSSQRAVSYVVTSTYVGPSCIPLDGDERHDHPLLHVSPGNQHVAQLLYRFWNKNPARIVPPGRLKTGKWQRKLVYVIEHCRIHAAVANPLGEIQKHDNLLYRKSATKPCRGFLEEFTCRRISAAVLKDWRHVWRTGVFASRICVSSTRLLLTHR